nr:zinc finger, CCHC-type [Tanacetum cinerariifolium]
MDDAAMKHMALNFAKLDKFEGVNSRRWQKKIHFLLSSMSVVYVLNTPIPEYCGDVETVEQIKKRAKWDIDDYVYRGLILNELGSHLRIENSLRIQDSDKPKGNKVVGPLVVNMVEHNNSSTYNDNKSKSYFVQDDDVAWWVDLGATVHDEALDKFKVFKTKVELQQGSQIKRFRTDKGGEVWGCKEVVKLSNPKLKALGKRGIEFIFVGYAEHSNAFRFQVIKPTDSVSIKSIIESKDAIFDENRFSSVPRLSQRSLVNGTKDIGCSVIPEEVIKENDPKTFDEAMKSQDVVFWKKEINDEMDSIMGNNTWVLADLPLGFKSLGCKWIFKIKLKVNGTIKKFNVRMFIQGFKQKSRIDYFDTYALVARISTIRLLIAMTSIHNLIIHQMDVKTPFLDGDLDEEVYMNQPQGFIMPGNGKKDMGEADVILGIRIKHESNGIAISQSHYIEKVLKKFNYFDCTPMSTPMDTSEKLMPNNGQAVSQLKYYRVISCLMYAMTCTRPTIAFTVGELSRYTSNLDASKKAEWLKNLLLEIPLWSKPIAPISIRCDSAATLAKAYSQMYK